MAKKGRKRSKIFSELLGKEVLIPASTFCSKEKKFVPGRIVARDKTRKDCVVVKFPDLPLRYYFPATAVKGWLDSAPSSVSRKDLLPLSDIPDGNKGRRRHAAAKNEAEDAKGTAEELSEDISGSSETTERSFRPPEEKRLKRDEDDVNRLLKDGSKPQLQHMWSGPMEAVAASTIQLLGKDLIRKEIEVPISKVYPGVELPGAVCIAEVLGTHPDDPEQVHLRLVVSPHQCLYLPVAEVLSWHMATTSRHQGQSTDQAIGPTAEKTGNWGPQGSKERRKRSLPSLPPGGEVNPATLNEAVAAEALTTMSERSGVKEENPLPGVEP